MISRVELKKRDSTGNWKKTKQRKVQLKRYHANKDVYNARKRKKRLWEREERNPNVSKEAKKQREKGENWNKEKKELKEIERKETTEIKWKQ